MGGALAPAWKPRRSTAAMPTTQISARLATNADHVSRSAMRSSAPIPARELRVDTMPRTPKSSSPFWKVVNAGARANVAIYRASGGRFGAHIGKAPVLLLHHVGRKSGKARVAPVLYLDDGDRLVVVASKGGTDKNPAWFHNLMANPETEVEVGRDRRRVLARRAEGEEREALWPRLVEIYSDYADYQTYTDRLIPVVVLEPR